MAATLGTEGSGGSGRVPFEQRAATLPGVSAPSSVVRSIIRIASSSAQTLEAFLIERLPSEAARSSTATWSTVRTPPMTEPRWTRDEIATTGRAYPSADLALTPDGLKAVGAVDGAGAGRQEGHLGRLAAVGADDVVHFARTPVAAGVAGPAGLPAVVTAAGLVHQAPLGVELLLTGGEDELFAAVAAGQRLVGEAHVRVLLGRFLVACGRLGRENGERMFRLRRRGKYNRISAKKLRALGSISSSHAEGIRSRGPERRAGLPEHHGDGPRRGHQGPGHRPHRRGHRGRGARDRRGGPQLDHGGPRRAPREGASEVAGGRGFEAPAHRLLLHRQRAEG